jgi:hypothetical protein
MHVPARSDDRLLSRYGSILFVAVVVLAVLSVATPATAAASTSVSLSSDTSTVGVGDTATYDIVVDNVDNDVSTYNLTVSTSDASTAAITGVSLEETDASNSLTAVDFAADNSSVTVHTIEGTATNGVIGSVTVTGESAGNADLDISVPTLGDDDANAYTVTGTSGATLDVSEASTGGTTVDLQGPSNVAVGSTATQDIVLNNATDGVAAYELTVTTNNTSALELTSADPAGNPQFVQTVDVSGDNSTATFELAYGNNKLAGGDAVTLGSVGVEGVADGAASLEVAVSRVDDGTQAQNSYTVTNTPLSTLVSVGGSDGGADDDGSTVMIEGVRQVNVGNAGTHEIVLENASEGVGAYKLTVTTDDASVLELTGAAPAGNPQFVQTASVSQDNSTATFDLGYGSNGLAGGTAVTLAMVDIAGVAEGTANVSVSVERITDTTSAQNSYSVANTPEARVSVGQSSAPIVVGDKPANDRDGDDKLDDVDGDGDTTIFDVQALFKNLGTDTISQNSDKFNFDGQGDVDIFDVQKLFKMLN